MPGDSTIRGTVNLCFDFDAMSLWLGWGTRGARALSRGEFGARVGAPRILELLERHEVPSTWFIPGHTAETFPEVVFDVAARSHEIGNHGYLHEAFDTLGYDDVRSIIRRANDALERVTGQRPRGLRAPAGDFDGHLMEMLVDEGFAYDSSRFDGEYELYWARGLDQLPDNGPAVFGRRLDLVEVPLNNVMQDFIYFESNYGTPLLTGSCAPSQVEEIWLGQLEYMLANVAGGVLTLTMHPQAIGWGGRIGILDRFIDRCKSAGLRFATCATLADEFRLAQAQTAVA